ncbi:MAG: transcription termination factor NusA [bacterium]|nr:transcription termination factor NusA [bacterium]
MAQYKPRTEFAAALSQIAAERGISAEVIVETIKGAIVLAYRRDARERGIEISEEEEFEVEMNPDTGEVKITTDRKGKKEDVTPPGFSRIAIQTAKQVISQKIREAEKSAVIEEYSKRLGTLVSGMVLRFDGSSVIVDLGKTEAVMTQLEQVRSESYRAGQRMTFYLEGIREGMRGQQIIVSRTSENLVKELFRREVPEVSSGAVEAKAIAREPGVRTKIAVFSNRAGIDPVGSCVGQKGVRVGEIINELFGEKIDIIQFDENTSSFVKSALAPAEGMTVTLDTKNQTAKVVVPDDQLSLAIGKDGQNVRLASRLTRFKIDIVGQGQEKEPKEKKKEKKEVTETIKKPRLIRKTKKKETAETEEEPK